MTIQASTVATSLKRLSSLSISGLPTYIVPQKCLSVALIASHTHCKNIRALLKIVGRGMSEVGTAVQFRKEVITAQQSGGSSVELQLKRMREVL